MIPRLLGVGIFQLTLAPTSATAARLPMLPTASGARNNPVKPVTNGFAMFSAAGYLAAKNKL
jgi:hypothetical protein